MQGQLGKILMLVFAGMVVIYTVAPLASEAVQVFRQAQCMIESRGKC